MHTERTSENYSLQRDRFGGYIITRSADNSSAYLQGDDAVQFENEYGAGCISDQMFDWACSQYDDNMETFADHFASL